MKTIRTIAASCALFPRGGACWLTPGFNTLPTRHSHPVERTPIARFERHQPITAMRQAGVTRLHLQQREDQPNERSFSDKHPPALRLGELVFESAGGNQVTVQTPEKKFALPRRLNLEFLETVEHESLSNDRHFRKTFTALSSQDTDYLVVSIKGDIIEMMWDLSAEEQAKIVFSDEEDLDYYHHLTIPRTAFSTLLDFIQHGVTPASSVPQLERMLAKETQELGIFHDQHSSGAELPPFS